MARGRGRRSKQERKEAYDNMPTPQEIADAKRRLDEQADRADTLESANSLQGEAIENFRARIVALETENNLQAEAITNFRERIEALEAFRTRDAGFAAATKLVDPYQHGH